MSDRPALDQQVTFLYAQDAPACWDFYEHVLGLTLIQDQGPVRIFEVAGGRAFLGVCRAGAPRASANPRVEGGVCFTFVTADVDGWYGFLTAQGVAIPQPPEHSAQWQIYHFFLHDPAGNLLEFQRFERPDWPAPPDRGPRADGNLLPLRASFHPGTAGLLSGTAFPGRPAMRSIALVLAMSFALLASGCAEVPLDYHYGPPISNFGQPHFANNGGA